MANQEIVIRVGLSELQRAQAAKLYAESFKQKFQPMLTTISQGSLVLGADFDRRLAVIALEEDKLVGLAGMQHDGRHFVNFRYITFMSEYGMLSGSLRCAVCRLGYGRPHEKGVLLMDGIAVAPEMRGRGVGTQLLEAVFDHARKSGFERVRLDVINTNPKARRLYERMGFVAAETHRYPFIERWAGFSAVTTMYLKV